MLVKEITKFGKHLSPKVRIKMNSLNLNLISGRPLDYKICPFTLRNKHLLLLISNVAQAQAQVFSGKRQD